MYIVHGAWWKVDVAGIGFDALCGFTYARLSDVSWIGLEGPVAG
jgi:hypothetical protein